MAKVFTFGGREFHKWCGNDNMTADEWRRDQRRSRRDRLGELLEEED